MLSLVDLFSDPNSVCTWELMKCSVFTKIKAGFVSVTSQGGMDIDFHALGSGQAGSVVDHMDTSTWSESSQGDPGISTSSGEKQTGKGGERWVGTVYNRCVSQCPCCGEQLDPLTVPNT